MTTILLAMCLGASWGAAYYSAKSARAAAKTEQYMLALLAFMHDTPGESE